MIDLTKYELKPIYINGVFDHYGLVPKNRSEVAKSVSSDENSLQNGENDIKPKRT